MFCYAVREWESVRWSLVERSELLQEAEHESVGQGFHLYLRMLPCETELCARVAHITQNLYISGHRKQLFYWMILKRECPKNIDYFEC
jgi:hypothetical protein